MPHRAFEFVQLDVFTQTPLMGNPLAVFTDARGLDDPEMQALACEMNLSETTFILPRAPAIEAREGRQVRIFTITEELPFAGHPTLGTALYLHAAESATNPASPEIVLDLPVGKIPVRFNADSPQPATTRVNGQVFGEMQQRDPVFGITLSREAVAPVIGIAADDIPAEWPIQSVSTGLPFTIVAIRDQETLSHLQPRPAEAEQFLKETGGKFFYFLCPQRHDGRLEVRARMFFYGGEDPATGSAAGCAASWMVEHGIAQNDERVLIRQGVEAGRASEIFVSASRESGRVTNVRVGGYAIEVLRGTVNL